MASWLLDPGAVAGGRRDARRSPKTAERIAAELFNEIIDSDLGEGHGLPNEKALADHLGVGRASVREALRLLESRGAVTIRTGPGGGPRVRRPRPRDLSTALIINLQSERATLRDVLTTRELLEPQMMASAARTMTDNDVAALAETVDSILEDPDNHVLFLDQTHEFNRIVAASSGSNLLWLIVEAISTILADTIPEVPYDRARRQRVASDRRRIVRAISDRDSAAAAAATLARLQDMTVFWLQTYPDLAARPIRWHV